MAHQCLQATAVTCEADEEGGRQHKPVFNCVLFGCVAAKLVLRGQQRQVQARLREGLLLMCISGRQFPVVVHGHT